MELANKIRVSGDCEPDLRWTATQHGVYVHVPFCSHGCDFCAFYQVEPRRGDIERYLDAIEAEFSLCDGAAGCATAFWGGGTPGLLGARDLERLGRAQIQAFAAPRREWTVELAPGSVRAEKLETLKDLGVTRVSLGVQSLDPATLEALGRRHSLAQVRRAWDLIQSARFPSTNLDLIFAIPGQPGERWRADLDEAMRMGPDHISTYCLTFEEDTALFVRLSSGRVAIDAERERELYLETWERLSAGGYRQYEISNHARPGHECIHNVNTWRMGSWTGVGPSAASQEGTRRGANPADLDRWAEGVASGRRAAEDVVRLTRERLAEDALIFGLRMNEGVDLADLASRAGADALAAFAPVLDDLVAEGFAVWTAGRRIALTVSGRLVVDRIGAELLGAASAAGC